MISKFMEVLEKYPKNILDTRNPKKIFTKEYKNISEITEKELTLW